MTKHATPSTVLLKHHRKAWQRPTMTAAAAQVAARCAQENSDHPGFLLPRSARERRERERRAAARRRPAARCPTPTTRDTCDVPAVPAVNQPMILELMKWDYSEHRENVILVGARGSGTTHRAPALAVEACGRGRRVRCFRVTERATLLLEAREERHRARLRSQLVQRDRLVRDELGSVPARPVGAARLCDGISRAAERARVIGTTNRPFEAGQEVLGRARLTGATRDRLTHRGTIVETGKESYRLREARRRRRGAAAQLGSRAAVASTGE